MGSQPTVLIVDDSEAVCLTLSMMLEKHHYQTQAVRNSAEALHLTSERHFDLVLVDLNLGNESGAQLALQLLVNDPKQRIVIMSGAVNARAELDRHPDLRSRPILYKPFSRPELLDCLRTALNRAA